ncbi:MAG: hypothetical protein QG597_3336 [Actinomycetota bacterium]|nr:hypothetical protein [Actinomycetota bacterium]
MPTHSSHSKPTVAGLVVLVTAVALTGCGNTQESAVQPEAVTPSEAVASSEVTGQPELAGDQLLSVPMPGVVGAGAADCLRAKRAHNNTNNVCATWENNAPVFSAPAVLSNEVPNFTITSFDGDAGSHHHVNQTPVAFGPWTWGATSAEKFYDATMAWQFASAEPPDTVTGNAKHDFDSAVGSSCSTATQYLNCFVSKAEQNPNFDGEHAYLLTYGLINAPLTVQIRNNTGKTMTQQGSPAQNYVLPSAKGTAGTATIAPAAGGQAQAATFGMYRANGGQASSFQVVYAFPDTNDAAVTHVVTVKADIAPTRTDDVRTWTANTSKSSCVDNPIGGSSPAKAECAIGWTGDSGWFASAVMTVNVANT